MAINTFINDIDKIFYQTTTDPVVLNSSKLNCLISADKVLLLSESEERSQSCLNVLQRYCDYWKLQVNIEKTKMIIGKRKIKIFNLNYMILY